MEYSQCLEIFKRDISCGSCENDSTDLLSFSVLPRKSPVGNFRKHPETDNKYSGKVCPIYKGMKTQCIKSKDKKVNYFETEEFRHYILYMYYIDKLL